LKGGEYLFGKSRRFCITLRPRESQRFASSISGVGEFAVLGVSGGQSGEQRGLLAIGQRTCTACEQNGACSIAQIRVGISRQGPGQLVEQWRRIRRRKCDPAQLSRSV